MIIDSKLLEEKVQRLGADVFREIKTAPAGLLDPQYYTGKLMDWAMRDEDFKIALFRFVDVFPTLSDAAAIIEHAKEYFTPVSERIPGILKWGLKVDPRSLSAKLSAPLIAHQIKSMASRFILGENPRAALPALKRIRQGKMAFTVDLLGEASVSETEAIAYLQRYFELLDVLAKEVPSWREARPIVEGHRGETSPLNISVKLSALYSQAKPLAAKRTVGVLVNRLSEILHRAKQAGAFVCVDMEDSSLTSITLDTFKETLSLPEFRDYDRCGVVLQAYLRRTDDDCDELIRWARSRGTPIGVRLVKGAYWDTETIMAMQRGWPIPVFQEKQLTDACYERVAMKLLANQDIIFPAFASHNLRSLSVVAGAAELLKVAPSAFELQALYGMAEPIKKAFADRGFLVREYAPIGELVPGMGYLVRRLLENTSNEGFLRQSFYEHEEAQHLLQAPDTNIEDTGTKHLGVPVRQEFSNSAPRDFSTSAARDALAKQIEGLRNKLRAKAEAVKPVVAGRYLSSERNVASVSPEEPGFKVADVQFADRKTAEEAVRSLWEFFPVWRDTPPADRAQVLFRAAELLESHRDELSAVEVLEAGKPWNEADADVAEAIDFCNYYAHEMLRLGTPRLMGRSPGEMNSYFYEPRGLALVVSPWNFPLAIPCGMFAAALVTGNVAILKPSAQTSLIASRLFDTFLAAGLPERAAAFLPSSGRDVGSFLVRHPLVSTIAFTGSKEVGLDMLQSAGITSPAAPQVKRVIAEMGGKNAIIVDDDADLDEAVRGVVYSAFGYAGQKCSACSRVIIVGNAYDRFVARLSEAVKSIVVGPASDPATTVGPVIDEGSQKRIQGIIEESRAKCTLAVEGGQTYHNLTEGYYVQPAVFTDVPLGHKLLTEEIFGPVLAVVKAKDFDHALEIALDSEFALTGAIFSRSPERIKRAVQAFRVGNLYINRGSTGALVLRQPFGGFAMSGVGSKAGGPDYLLQFMVPRSVSENTMRRGFAPKI